MLIVGGYLLHDSFTGRQDVIDLHLQSSAKAIRAITERELASMQASLKVLATSSALHSRDFAWFHRQAQEVLKNYPGADIILADSTGQQFVNTRLPLGASLPIRNNPEMVRAIFETGKPHVSDVFKGAVSGRHLVGVDVPVWINGVVAYDLALTVPADRFLAILQDQKLPEDSVSLILDSKRTFIARSKHPEKAVGQPLQPLKYILVQRNGDSTEGVAEGTSIEGVPIRIGFSRSLEYGWSVAVNIPKAVLMAGLWRWIWLLGGMVLAALLVGSGLAAYVGRSIVRDVDKLSKGARSIAQGDLSHRIEMDGVTELTDLSRSFNSMAESLSVSRDIQKMHKEQLERQVAERTSQLTASLIEKEVMLKEIHHRVKNNLQIISSLLSLQGEALDNPDALNILNDSQLRVLSMALIHQQLYGSDDLGSIDSGLYLGQLASSIRAAFEGSCDVHIRVHVQDMKLSLDRAIPFGLLMNELLTNSMKHAFTGRLSGTITINAARQGDDLVVTVADDGVGLPDGFDEKNVSTLGLQIVTMLASQLHGEVSVASPGGVSVLLRIPFQPMAAA